MDSQTCKMGKMGSQTGKTGNQTGTMDNQTKTTGSQTGTGNQTGTMDSQTGTTGSNTRTVGSQTGGKGQKEFDIFLSVNTLYHKQTEAEKQQHSNPTSTRKTQKPEQSIKLLKVPSHRLVMDRNGG